MSKTSLKQLAQDGATNGQAVIWNNTSAKWVPGTMGITTTLTAFGGTPNANAGNITSGGVLQLSPADAANPGGVSTASGGQSFAGPKTFIAPLTVQAPYVAVTDIYFKAGSSTADASVLAGAKLFSARTGIGGTEVEYFSVLRSTSTAGTVVCSPPSSAAADICVKVGTSTADATINVATKLFTVRAGIGGTEIEHVSVTKQGLTTMGEINATGSFTTTFFAGIATVLLGTASTTITHASFTATSRILITWLGDHGAARSWVQRAAGSFTVTLSSAASVATPFSWEVSSLA